MHTILELQFPAHTLPRVTINTDDPDTLRNTTDIQAGTVYDIEDLVGKLYPTNKPFLDAVGIPADDQDDYWPTNTYTSSTVFKTIIEAAYDTPVSDRDTAKAIADIYTHRLQAALHNNETVRTAFTVDSTSRDFVAPELLDDAILLTKNKAIKLTAETVDDVTSLDDLTAAIGNDMKDALTAQAQVRYQAWQDQVTALQDRVKEAKEHAFVRGIQLVNELDDWVIDGEWLVYQNKIYATHVERNGHTYRLNHPKQFYVDGLKLRIRDTPGSMYAGESYHPHVEHQEREDSKICAGDLNNASLKQQLETAPTQLKTIVFGDGWGNNAESALTRNWDDRVTLEDEATTWEVEE